MIESRWCGRTSILDDTYCERCRKDRDELEEKQKLRKWLKEVDKLMGEK